MSLPARSSLWGDTGGEAKKGEKIEKQSKISTYSINLFQQCIANQIFNAN